MTPEPLKPGDEVRLPPGMWDEVGVIVDRHPRIPGGWSVDAGLGYWLFFESDELELVR